MVRQVVGRNIAAKVRPDVDSRCCHTKASTCRSHSQITAGTASVELAGGTKRATTASARRWSPGPMTRQGVGRKHGGKVRLDAAVKGKCKLEPPSEMQPRRYDTSGKE